MNEYATNTVYIYIYLYIFIHIQTYPIMNEKQNEKPNENKMNKMFKGFPVCGCQRILKDISTKYINI